MKTKILIKKRTARFPTPLLFFLTGGLFESGTATVVRTIGGSFRGGRVSLHVGVIRAADERKEGTERHEGFAARVDILRPSRIWVAVCFTLVRGVRVGPFQGGHFMVLCLVCRTNVHHRCLPMYEARQVLFESRSIVKNAKKKVYALPI